MLFGLSIPHVALLPALSQRRSLPRPRWWRGFCARLSRAPSITNRSDSLPAVGSPPLRQSAYLSLADLPCGSHCPSSAWVDAHRRSVQGLPRFAPGSCHMPCSWTPAAVLPVSGFANAPASLSRCRNGPLRSVGRSGLRLRSHPRPPLLTLDHGAESLQESAAPLTACGIPCVRLTSLVHDLPAIPPEVQHWVHDGELGPS
jgi:hypothetical protein